MSLLPSQWYAAAMLVRQVVASVLPHQPSTAWMHPTVAMNMVQY
jgi:hypothetical protein